MLSSRTLTRRGTPKAKTVMMWILQNLLSSFTTVVFFIENNRVSVLGIAIANRILGKSLGIISSSLLPFTTSMTT